jgi:aminoglycoside phosphotransferase (APT) family kinase protein
MTELVESSVDWSVVESWLAAKGVADGEVTAIEQIGGGTQNLMFRFRCGDVRLVLRRGHCTRARIRTTRCDARPGC